MKCAHLIAAINLCCECPVRPVGGATHIAQRSSQIATRADEPMSRRTEGRAGGQADRQTDRGAALRMGQPHTYGVYAYAERGP